MVLWVPVDLLGQAVQMHLVNRKDQDRQDYLDCQAGPPVPMVRLVRAARWDQLALVDPMDRVSQENQRVPEDPDFLVAQRNLGLRWGPEVQKVRAVPVDRAVLEVPDNQKVQVVLFNKKTCQNVYIKRIVELALHLGRRFQSVINI